MGRSKKTEKTETSDDGDSNKTPLQDKSKRPIIDNTNIKYNIKSVGANWDGYILNKDAAKKRIQRRILPENGAKPNMRGHGEDMAFLKQSNYRSIEEFEQWTAAYCEKFTYKGPDGQRYKDWKVKDNVNLTLITPPTPSRQTVANKIKAELTSSQPSTQTGSSQKQTSRDTNQGDAQKTAMAAIMSLDPLSSTMNAITYAGTQMHTLKANSGQWKRISEAIQQLNGIAFDQAVMAKMDEVRPMLANNIERRHQQDRLNEKLTIRAQLKSTGDAYWGRDVADYDAAEAKAEAEEVEEEVEEEEKVNKPNTQPPKRTRDKLKDEARQPQGVIETLTISDVDSNSAKEEAVRATVGQIARKKPATSSAQEEIEPGQDEAPPAKRRKISDEDTEEESPLFMSQDQYENMDDEKPKEDGIYREEDGIYREEDGIYREDNGEAREESREL